VLACVRVHACVLVGNLAPNQVWLWAKQINAQSSFRDKSTLASDHSLQEPAMHKRDLLVGPTWYDDGQHREIRAKCRPMALWSLPLAGDWSVDMINRPKQYMRVMLIKNVDVENRFANGTQGYVMYWQPGSAGRSKRSKYAVDVDFPSVMVTFAKQSSVASGKPRYYEGVDKMDLKPMLEHLPGSYQHSVMEQLPIIPAYGLTTHKSQSLTMRHLVKVCLEGIFAHGSAQHSCLRSAGVKDICGYVCVMDLGLA
jgi:hypothetical protein